MNCAIYPFESGEGEDGRAEDYRWSSHRAYLGVEKCSWVDCEPVLRHFGASRKRAESYQAFVNAGSGQGHREELSGAVEGRFVGGEGFVGEVKHRIGEAPVVKGKQRAQEVWNWAEAVRRVEEVLGVKLKQIQGRGKAAAQTRAKEVMIHVGRERGRLGGNELAERLGIDASNVTRGYERARERLRTDGEFRNLIERVLAK